MGLQGMDRWKHLIPFTWDMFATSNWPKPKRQVTTVDIGVIGHAEVHAEIVDRWLREADSRLNFIGCNVAVFLRPTLYFAIRLG